MKNPVLITLLDNSHVEIGDPFILRFNGRYYLYCSTCDEEEGIRCFTSDDLVNFTYYGLVAKSPILKHAYAPEVILHNDQFIMCTSPRGNGHYFLKSTSPLGPFEFVTDNIHSMIDGSFVLDENNQLHFLRADHNGIAYFDVKNNALFNRKDILPQISHAWTEGPSVTYFNSYYYISYCGNDVLSPSYRVKIASSKSLDKDYRVSASPLLLSTEKGYSALGHNSIVLGPSLDEYFVAYHKLDWVDERHTTRYLCLDRLYFNGRECACNPSNFEVLSPKRPDYECHINEKCTLEKVDRLLLTSVSSKSEYTIEFNVKGYSELVVGYQNDKNYSIISLNDEIEIYQINNGRKVLLKKHNCKFDFKHFHTIRVINHKKCEILIDNVPIILTSRFDDGRCGFVYKDEGIYYFALTNSVNSESMKNIPHIVPGKIEANYSQGDNNLKLEEDEIYSLTLKKGDSVKYYLTGKEKKKYKLFARMNNETVKLEVASKNSRKIVNIYSNESEYKFNFRYLLDLELEKVDEITIEVLKGKFTFQYLYVEALIETESVITNEKLSSDGEFYLFTNHNSNQQIEFELKDENNDNLFGLIVNSTDYTSWPSNKTMKYLGYFVGFDNNLLVIDYCQYDRTRIFDKPYRLEVNKSYKLRVELKDNLIDVFINDKLEISTSLKYDQGYGLSGVYKSNHSKVHLYNYKEGVNDEK